MESIPFKKELGRAKAYLVRIQRKRSQLSGRLRNSIDAGRRIDNSAFEQLGQGRKSPCGIYSDRRYATVAEANLEITHNMRNHFKISVLLCLFIGTLAATAAAQGITRPVPVLDKVVGGMPRGEKQEIRVMTAVFKPGDRTLFHTHRFPVTVYILEGEFTLDLANRKEPVVIKAGESFVEPIGVKMTGYNRSTLSTLRLVIFYVSDADTPFLDPIDPGKHDSHKGQ